MKPLQVSDKAPAFSGKDQNGKLISLSGFKGRKLILYFYPKDNTPTCTTEACNLQENYSFLLKKGYDVVGVSADNEKSHLKFAAKYNLKFSLITDIDMKIINSYGCWGEKVLFGRHYMGILRRTFIIDENGKIEKIIDKVESKNHTDQLLNSK